MKRSAVAVCLLLLPLLHACGGGPVYRGAPPAGKTDAEYKCEIAGECPMRTVSPMRDASRNAPNQPAF